MWSSTLRPKALIEQFLYHNAKEWKAEILESQKLSKIHNEKSKSE